MLSMLTRDNLIYINLHFIQVFDTIFLDSSIYALKEKNGNYFKSNKGIYQRTLTQNTIEKVKNELSSYEQKKIFLDMKYICSVEDNQLVEFKNLLVNILDNKNTLFLHNVSGEVWESLKKLGMDMKEEYDTDSRMFYITLPSIKYNKEDLIQMTQFATEIFEEKFERELTKCCEKHERESMSSRVRLNIYINIKKMMRDFPFFCYCIYKLALELTEIGVLNINHPEQNRDKTIFVHTMNSVVIGTIIAQLFCIDILLVDHLGPYNKLYVDDLSRTIDYKKKYLIVSDVVCMGTELSNAKTILDVLGIHYNGCIALVNIVPIGTDSEDIYSLYIINKDKNIVNYRISTDL